MIARIQATNCGAGALVAKYDSSRCVCAFTSPGSTRRRRDRVCVQLWRSALRHGRAPDPRSPSHRVPAARRPEQSTPRSGSTWNDAELLAGTVARRALLQLLGTVVSPSSRAVASSSMRGIRAAKDRCAKSLVMHVAALRLEAGIPDVADDLDCPCSSAGGANDVFLDHHAAHVVGAVGQAQLSDLPPCRPTTPAGCRSCRARCGLGRACAGSRRRSLRCRQVP